MTKPDQEKLWALIETDYLGYDKKALQRSFANHLEYTQSKTRYTTEALDCYKSAAYAVKDRLMERWNDANQTYYDKNAKRVYYLSMEFLMGRALNNALLNLGILKEMEEALKEFGYSLEDLSKLEVDAGLGNGGLGRLAACFLDSLATLQIPGEGYGIRYDYGIFEQEIRDGYQVEKPENWLRAGYPWEIMRPEYQYTIHFHGNVKNYKDDMGNVVYEWVNTEKVYALAYDIPIPGYKSPTVNTLRLWSAKATQEFELSEFNMGDYIGAVQSKIKSETISSVLYPKDDILPGKELRLKQEYFFVSATIQDIIRRHKVKNPSVLNLHEKVAIQLNDTHPALVIAELMRFLVDIEKIGWAQAWEICVHTCAYTNHTMMPEALELWPVSIMESLLPRHMQIIYEINRQFLENVSQQYPHDPGKIGRMSIIQEYPGKAVRMSHLAIVGSHAVNGVSALHTELVKKKLFLDFSQLWPKKFINITNGITQRRWLLLANPSLSQLITNTIGEKWITDLRELKQLIPWAAKKDFQKSWHTIKHKNKEILAAYIKEHNGITVNPHSLFDVQVKRIHEYKRQLLNVLNILRLYTAIKEKRIPDCVPRTFIFAGKAAPSYYKAKLIIKLINSVATMVNNDPAIEDRIKVVFLSNYCVSLAQKIIPSADLSEQISTAGMEASGTGNMKFALNGALTIGTLDGANIEMREEIGYDNIFIFGLNAEGVKNLRECGYASIDWYNKNQELKAVIDMISSGMLNPGQPDLFKPITDSLLYGGDPFFILADFQAYVMCQERVSSLYQDQDAWNKMSILNLANMGKFSSDRTIKEYTEKIWHAKPVKAKAHSMKRPYKHTP
ncbi:MAG: glycogen/starch/alpha-glucan phosphorylase [bacterium]